MKPKDLNFPFSWEERRIHHEDRLLTIPKCYAQYDEWSFPGWDAIFGNQNPVHVEYCSGNGSWIIEKAQENPAINWVAVEMKFPRVQKIWAKMKNRSLSNLWIVCGEAHATTKNYLPSSTVACAYVNFPDPWPKKRHAKHRLIHSAFVSEVSRILPENGDFILVTDDISYSEQMVHTITANDAFSSQLPYPHYQSDWPSYGTSYFDSLWREKGKTIRYHPFKKVEIACPIA